MIQDIAPHVLFNQYDTEAKPCASDFVIHTLGNDVLLKGPVDGSGTPELPVVGDYADDAKFIYLFKVDEQAFFMPDAARFGKKRADEIPEGCSWVGLRTLKGIGFGPKEFNYAVLTGKHLTDWYRDAKYCGRCGAKMEFSGTERAMVCPHCGYAHYPRIMPAVIVACIKGDKILATRYSKGYKHYALIAGFTEIGETLEETVAREVMEETGIKVKNIRYYKSQPWGIANDILVGFICEADGDDEIVIDENELSEALWMSPDDLEIGYDDYSLTNELLWKFKNGEI